MSKVTTFDYQFKFADGTLNSYVVEVSHDTFKQVPRARNQAAPAWTALEFNQCTHCPYNKAEKPSCPVALNLAEASEAFKDAKSFSEVTVFVKTENRFFGKTTDLQTGLQSLFGLVMATSDCSHFDFFRGLARNHLPFATFQETAGKAFGHYLMKRYFESKHDGAETQMSIVLTDFSKYYEQVSLVNHGIIGRIRSISKGDAGKNAIVILDNFAALLPMELESGLQELEQMFKV
jgi:hypothetical protein